MTPEQQVIVACWERHEVAKPNTGHRRLVQLVTAETGAHADAIVGAWLAQLKADGGALR
jgi:hypothetical protein